MTRNLATGSPMTLDEIESVLSVLGEVYHGVDGHLTLATVPPHNVMEAWARRLAAVLDFCEFVVNRQVGPDEGPPGDGGANQHRSSHGATTSLANLGITKDQSSRGVILQWKRRT